MKKTEIKEGKAKINIYTDDKISKELPVFYNPVMKLNRDISILLLNAIDKKAMQMADIMAGSGVRGIRFLKELRKGKIKNLTMNDCCEKSVRLIRDNASLNRISKNTLKITKSDANLFLLNSKGFDYIDIDPFGTPNPFLDSAMKRLARDGILAVTATDTAPLAGTYPKTCKRKYWALPLRNHMMHEAAIRILIRKVQLVASQYEKSLKPVFSLSTDHYYRVFFRNEKGKSKVDTLLKDHNYILHCPKCAQTRTSEFNIGFCCASKMEYAGPLYTGPLWDSKLISKMKKENKDEKTVKLLNTISKEAMIKTVGFYDIHAFCKTHNIRQIPKTEVLMKRMKRKGITYSPTHFSDTGIRTDIESPEFRSLFI